MRGVDIKAIGADRNVFRIGRFKNNFATGLEHSQAVIKQANQLLKRQVLNNVKGGDKMQAVVGQAG